MKPEGEIKTLDQQLAVYSAYHRNTFNRLTHFFGVPLIMFSMFVPLSWVQVPLFDIKLTGAVILVVIVCFCYFRFDAMLALVCTFLSALLLLGAYWVATAFPPTVGWSVFVVGFVGGWILQMAGHVFEGRRPALIDNIWQIFVAPIFLVAEGFFALGLKGEIRERINKQQAG